MTGYRGQQRWGSNLEGNSENCLLKAMAGRSVGIWLAAVGEQVVPSQVDGSRRHMEEKQRPENDGNKSETVSATRCVVGTPV